MEPVIPGVYASAPQPLPFDTSIDIRAFLLQRAAGNVLIYSTATLASERETIEGLGGLSRRYLGHEHEAMFGCDQIEAALHCHEAAQAAVAKHCPVAASFATRHGVGDDLEVIPIPGHTPGSTAFLWDSGQHRCLFTGDTVYLRDGEWIGGFLPGSSDREAFIASLELLRDLDFDVLIPWPASHGGPFHASTDRHDVKRRIGAILERLRRGENE